MIRVALIALLFVGCATAEAAMYEKLKAMEPSAAARYVYTRYALIGKDPEVQRWINENAAVYADTVRTLRNAPRNEKL